MLKKITIAFFVIIQSAVGQDVQIGSCGADIKGISDFNLNDYAGTWYQIERIDNEFEGACSRTTFYPAEEGYLTLNSTRVINGDLEYTLGVARVDSSDGSGRLELTFRFSVDESFFEATAHQYVIAMEASDYALVMGCDDSEGDYRSIFAWKLSRTKILTPEAVSAINNIVTDNPYLSSVNWKETDQSIATCGISTP